MSDDEQVQRSRVAGRVFDLWGEERADADAGLIESASRALARIDGLQPRATILLDQQEDDERG